MVSILVRYGSWTDSYCWRTTSRYGYFCKVCSVPGFSTSRITGSLGSPTSARQAVTIVLKYRQKQAAQQGKLRALVFWQGGQDGKDKKTAMRRHPCRGSDGLRGRRLHHSVRVAILGESSLRHSRIIRPKCGPGTRFCPIWSEFWSRHLPIKMIGSSVLDCNATGATGGIVYVCVFTPPASARLPRLRWPCCSALRQALRPATPPFASPARAPTKPISAGSPVTSGATRQSSIAWYEPPRKADMPPAPRAGQRPHATAWRRSIATTDRPSPTRSPRIRA